MEKDSALSPEEQRPPTIDELKAYMVIIIGTLKWPAEGIWVTSYLPKPHAELFRAEVLRMGSEARGWHFRTNSNRYIAETLGALAEPVKPIGFRLTPEDGVQAYKEILGSSEDSENPPFPYAGEIIDRIEAGTGE